MISPSLKDSCLRITNESPSLILPPVSSSPCLLHLFFYKQTPIKERMGNLYSRLKNSGLSKVSWCQKQNLSVHQFILLVEKLSPETEDQNKNERVN
ncbi:IS66 family insertion sequence element accessory protein TnpA [Bacillus paramycoides]|uniref:IS66 family insertion sequence element accessory protein TnpA n=1 Tax=Bacillus paramycoides TaxID=2026194 RepID=UPI00399D1610